MKHDKLGRKRHPNQDAALNVIRYSGRVSRSHNISMSALAHDLLSRLTPQERGDLITRAIEREVSELGGNT